MARQSGERAVGGVPAEATEERGVRDLIRDVTHDITELLREEMALARVELRQEFRQLAKGAMLLVVAAFVVNAGFLALTASAVLGLATAVTAWLSALLVGVAMAVVGGILLMRGMRDIKEADLKPERTIETLKRDAQVIKERGHE